MRSPTSEKILSETPQEVKDKVKVIADESRNHRTKYLWACAELNEAKKEIDRLKTEHREHMLLVRKYFNARDVAYNTGDVQQAAEAVLKEAETEKQIRKELKEFTREDVEQLPFKD